MSLPTERDLADDLFRLAVEAAPSGMVLVDQEGKIVLINSQTERLFGYTREELLGQPVEILLSESSRGSKPVLHGSSFHKPQVQPMGIGQELYARRKDGTPFPVKVGINPVETEQGTWALNSIVDVTERKRAEAALHESEERFGHMADTAPVMIWVSGPDKLCTFFNKVWLDFTGRTMKQELGNGWTASVHPDDLDRCLDTYSTAFDARRDFQMEYRVRRRDGEYRWVLDNGVPRFAPDGTFAGYIGSCLDVTENKRTQEAAFARQKLESLGVLTGGIAHDFGNILSGIIAHAELLREDLGADSPAAKEVQSIIDISLRGSEIVHELMIYTGNDKSNLELLDISVLVQEMIELLKISISKHATLETHFGKRLPAVLASATHIRQIVMNLIINAAEAIGEKAGRIEITTSHLTSEQASAFSSLSNRPEGGYVRLEVSDTGNGMTPEVQARIFDPFFTTKPEGRGLGLAVIQAIVRRYGGVINVTSAPGQGTRFGIMLPCAGEVATQSRTARTGD